MSRAAPSEHHVTLRLLGPPALNPGPGEHPFAAERPYLLLGLLASRADWLRRDELADLLYPGRDLKSARSNLRKVLFLARKVPGVGAIEQRGDLLRWRPPSDLAAFETACDERRWADAVDAYGGALLMGLDAACPPTAAEWLDGERQRLQARWHEACTRRLAQLADDPRAGASLAQAMLRDDPLDDVALLALGRAQQALGQADAALQLLADYGDRLARETGLVPSAVLQSLGVALRTAAPAPAATAPPPSGLVGRRQELTQVLERLADPQCRVLTLLGPPGVGKSALARTLQAELQGAWVALEDLTHADQVPERVAAALGALLDGSLPPWDALARALAQRQAVLVLDGAEHLALAAPLQALLGAAPRLRVLAASRAPLGLAGEWRHPLEGLPLPDRDETEPGVLLANDAVRLFVQRARAVAPAFDLAAEAADVVRLVHEVEGLPLAIELLAAWRRLMPVADILAELADSLDMLEPTLPHERSVRASFARAWQQLEPVEQRVLAQLALLPAPVDREQVRQVLQAPLPVLAALADRSLLRADGDGRFSLHPLIRRCAAPLATDAEAVHEQHARHVARRLGGRAAHVQPEDLPHLRAAWRWSLAHAELALLKDLRAPLNLLQQRRALWREGLQSTHDEAALRRPLVQRADGTEHPEQARELARVLWRQASFCYQLGMLDDALAAAVESEALARRHGDDGTAALAAGRQGAVWWQRGDSAAARVAFQRQCTAFEGRPDRELDLARARGWLALVDKADGDYERAREGYEHAIVLTRAAGQLASNLYLVNNLGNLLRSTGRHAEALRLLHEGLQLARAGGSLEDEPFLLTNIANVHEDAGDHAAALQWAERAVASASGQGEPMIEAAARMTRARMAAAMGHERRAALADLWDALSIATRVKSPPLRAQCLCTAGIVLARLGAPAPGLALSRWALAQPELGTSDRHDLQRCLQALPPAPEAGAAALLAPDAPVDDALALLQAAATA